MISLIRKGLIAKRVNHLLKENQITILHYLPGRIRLGSPLWKKNSNTLKYLIEELRSEERIHSVSYTKETGSLLVVFDIAPIYRENQIDMWFQVLERVFNEAIHHRKERKDT